MGAGWQSSSAEMKSATLDFRRLRAFCRADLPVMLECIRRAVEIESPSHDQAGLHRLAQFIAGECRRQGGTVALLPQRNGGTGLVAEFWGKRKRRSAKEAREKPLLLLGHLDTVWPLGTLARMPFQIRAGRAYGPGTLDMKSGVAIGLAAIRSLKALDVSPAGPVRLLLTADEEVGSPDFRKRIEAEARRARAVLVLEPAAEGGALKTSRKGTGEFQIVVRGRASHAGINPERGVNAIGELARQLLRLETFADPQHGITVNVGRIEGGTRPNVVPESARAAVDVRIQRLADGARIARQIFGLKPIHPQARLEVKGGINRPPLERRHTVQLFRRAQELARKLGYEITEASTGGGSDGNFSAALGIPTLDGLGAAGDGAHAIHEHIVIRELPRRSALLAALLAEL